MSNFLLKKPHCVHIHICKNGGMSIRRGIWPGRKSEAGPLLGYDGPIFGEIPEDWQKYFSFAFVRHPMDRFFSAYRYFVTYRDYKGKIEDFAQEAMDPRLPIEDFRSIRHHTFPQTHPANCLQHADFVGRFENYVDDLLEILRIVGKKPSKTLPHKHRTEREAINLPEKTQRALETYYEQDFFELDYEPGVMPGGGV